MTPLRAFVDEHVGEVEVLAAPRRRGMTRVIHVRDRQGQEWFAKRFHVPARFKASAAAYVHWSGIRGVATPAAVDPERHCLLLPRIPGRQPEGTDLSALWGAGALLRRLHARPAPSWANTWRDTSSAQVDTLLATLPAQGITLDKAMITRHHEAMLTLDVPEVATHGDYQPHNWLKHRARVSVIDMESAALRPAAFDLARLRYAACWDRPRSFRTLLAGYGRTLNEAERHYIVAAMPWRALNAINLGLRARRPQMVSHGLRVLDHAAHNTIRAL